MSSQVEIPVDLLAQVAPARTRTAGIRSMAQLTGVSDDQMTSIVLVSVRFGASAIDAQEAALDSHLALVSSILAPAAPQLLHGARRDRRQPQRAEALVERRRRGSIGGDLSLPGLWRWRPQDIVGLPARNRTVTSCRFHVPEVLEVTDAGLAG